MRRIKFNLQTKLLVIFISFSLLLTAAISIGLNIVINDRFDNYVTSNFKARVESIADEVRSAYIQTGSLKKIKLGNLRLGNTMGMEVTITYLNGAPITSISRHMKGHSAQMMRNMHRQLNVAGSSATAPIYIKGKKIALVKVNSMMESGGIWSQQDVDFKNRLNMIILVTALAAFILAALISFLAAKGFIKPLNNLSAAAKTWGEGKFNTKAKVESSDEIGQLAEVFNLMARNLAIQQRERQNMLTDISHELRTPLTVLQNNIEALQDRIMKPTAENIQNIHDEVLRLNNLIEDLQTLALTDSASLTLKKTEIDLIKIGKEVSEKLQVFLRTKNIKLNIEGDTDVKINADINRIKQIIFNLVFNAYKYLDDGGWIKISIYKQSGTVRLIIQDNGPGISTADLPHIFDRFYSSGKGSGTGIGLTIVKRLVEAHDGTIQIDSAPGKGTTFTILIPE